MAIEITISIPGSPSNPDSAAGRTKKAIDSLFGFDPEAEGAPQSAAEYRSFVVNQWIIPDIKSRVHKQEQAIRAAMIAKPGDTIGIDAGPTP